MSCYTPLIIGLTIQIKQYLNKIDGSVERERVIEKLILDMKA